MVLCPVKPLNTYLTIWCKGWRTEILVLIFIKICPDNFLSLKADDAYLNFRICITCFGIPVIFDIPVLPVRYINRKNRYIGFIKTHKDYVSAIPAPPKCSGAYNFLFVYISGNAI